MYFPTSAVRRLSSTPALPNLPSEPVLDLLPSPRKSFFCTVTRNGVAVWRVRPSAVLAFLSRTPTSIIEHGENKLAHWSPDGGRIVIQTLESHLVLIVVEYHANGVVYNPPTTSRGPRNFMAGPGEGVPLQSISLHFEGVIRIDGGLLSVSPRKQSILFSTQNPPSLQRIPWPNSQHEHVRGIQHYDNWVLNQRELPWLVEADVSICQMLYSRAAGVETWRTSDGRVYFVQLREAPVYEASSTSELGYSEAAPSESRASFDSTATQSRSGWHGTCVHDFQTPKWVQKRRQVDAEDNSGKPSYEEPRRAVAVAINSRFTMIAVGTMGGSIEFINFPTEEGVASRGHTVKITNLYNRPTGSVCSMEWSSDGYVLAVGWKHGWAIVSVGGRCLASNFGVEDIDIKRFQDKFMNGVLDLFWGPGNFDLIVLAHPSSREDNGQLFVIPFAKSSTTSQHSPDNTRYAFLQMDDRALVYRGADQPDMSVINPESDVWQHIKIPQAYIASNWPIRYSSLSSDGRLIAVAGRRGLIHYSSTSGRWKTFADQVQEQAFMVKGGLLWFHHVLIAAVELSKSSYQIRLYSRDTELSNQNVLHREVISSPVVIMSLVDNSLLVYTADNTLHHFLIHPTASTITIMLCGSITFNGIIAVPSAVRLLSWMIPSAQKQLGDPVDDLSVATVLMMVGGQLVLLRPRKSRDHEVNYDLQIFADRIEFCWIHLRGISALENSLWAYDGQGIRVWLNALAIEPSTSSPQQQEVSSANESVKESVSIPLDFYPLSILMDKGIIIGAEHETATRSNLPFVTFRHATSSHLFLHHILQYHLELGLVKEAVTFASHYQHLVFFAHSLEILLHTVVESDATNQVAEVTDNEDNELSVTRGLPAVVQFLDYFDECLDIVVRCARKTEVTRWRRLFDVVGNPKELFEVCLAAQRLKTAASYLLVLHNLEQLDEDHEDVVRLLQSAVDGKDWQLCKELLRFLRSIDESGKSLGEAMAKTSLTSTISDV